MDQDRVKAFGKFIIERHQIYGRRLAGKRPPWTKDKILQTYRFCNVYRELDRVTEWIRDHWREPHADYKHLWFAMVVARLINHPPTLAKLALPGRWNKLHFLNVMSSLKEKKKKAFGSAYIVSTNGRAMDKAEYLAEHVLDPLWAERKDLIPHRGDTLAEYHACLSRFNGLGSFMAAQVVADLKYVQPLKSAADWWTFAASGPGSRRGLNRILGASVKASRTEKDWRIHLYRLHKKIRPIINKAGMDPLHFQDLQNCLCEFDKYERTRLLEGRPRQLFTPVGE